MKKNRVKRVVLIQPRARWGKHPYLPNGLLATAARLMAVGIHVRIIDMNITNNLSGADIAEADWVGIGILGAPYIPQAMKLAKYIQNKLRADVPIFFGGPVTSRLTDHEWQQLLESQDLRNITVIRDEEELGPNLGDRKIPSIFQTSMAPAIESLTKEMKRIYFSKEFCLFISDGCVYNCTFCAANKGQPEQFRDFHVVKDEVRIIANYVREYAGAVPNYEIYLSTLDGLQNPIPMETMLEIIRNAFLYEGVNVPLRFLATSRCTFKALQEDPEILHQWRSKYYVNCIGIGVDGADEESWRKLRKGHNKPDEIQTVFLEMQKAGIIPEALMIMGFAGESREATLKAEAACKTLTEQGIKVRPYEGKRDTLGTAFFSLAPFLNNINLFMHLEYAMLASKLTHPDWKERWFINYRYLKTIWYLKRHNKYGCPTQPLLSSEQGNFLFRFFGRSWNKLMPMDR